MHQPINERVTNLVATRQETTQVQAASASVVLNNNNNNNNNLALAPPLIKQEGHVVEEGQPRAQEAGLGLERGAGRGLNIETSEPPGLERGEVGPKLEIADGAPLVCRTCNRVSRRWKALRKP